VTRVDVHFLPFRDGARFCIVHSPDHERPTLGAAVYVHPFAEEMNKSRRMAALQARALAGAGWIVLQIDLFACGDSEGRFDEATWSQWIDDVSDASIWLYTQSGLLPMLWGLRSGCLIAAEAARRMDPSPNLLFWQPVLSGRQLLRQFLRLKLSSQVLLGDSGNRVRIDDLRQQILNGQVAEIGGYALSPGIALGMDASELLPPAAPVRAAWFEVVASPELSPAATERIRIWQAAGVQVDSRVIAGPPFWQTQEITECPELIEATVDAVTSWRK